MSRQIITSKEFCDTIFKATELAKERYHENISCEALLYVMLEEKNTNELLKECNVDIDSLDQDLENYFSDYLDDENKTFNKIPLSQLATETINVGAQRVLGANRTQFYNSDFILALIDFHSELETAAGTLLLNNGFDVLIMKEQLSHNPEYMHNDKADDEFNESEDAEKVNDITNKFKDL